jgi:alkylhydroperoxidase/carboxymuconolactone decarboxylase family protein YurZ
MRAGPVQWSARQVAIREEYTAARGYWATFLDPTLELAPDFLEAYLAFSAAPARVGVLDARTRELIYLAFDTSPTHLHQAGMRVHIRNALRLGVTPGELAEVMALSVGLGLGTLEFAMPILDEEVGRRTSEPREG